MKRIIILSAVLMVGTCLWGQDTDPEFVKLKAEAEKGDAQAQFNLGLYYRTKKDFSNAFVWFKKAAEQEQPEAERHLSDFFKNGLGGYSKDPVQAFNWAKRSAEHGNRGGSFNVAGCYLNGLGVEKDLMEGYAWLYVYSSYLTKENLAVASPIEVSKKYRPIDDATLLKAKDRSVVLLKTIADYKAKKAASQPASSQPAVESVTNVETPKPDNSGWVDLIKIIDPTKDDVSQTTKGTWSKINGLLLTKGNVRGSPPVVIEIQYRPGGEYELKAKYKMSKVDNVGFVLPYGNSGKSAWLSIGSYGKICCFQGGNKTEIELKANVEYTANIKVSKDGIVFSLNDKQILKQPFAGAKLAALHESVPRDFTHLSIVVYNAAVSFSSIQVKVDKSK